MPESPETGPGAPEQKAPISFSSFSIENPKIPDKDGDWVSLVDEESSAVNIDNLKRGEAKEIIEALNPIVEQAIKSKSNQTLEFRGTTRKINFRVEHYDEDGQDTISINGRDIEDENDEGSYCHDFEIEGITTDDWNKIKSLF